jgi:hypothetical protein
VAAIVRAPRSAPAAMSALPDPVIFNGSVGVRDTYNRPRNRPRGPQIYPAIEPEDL